MSSGKRKSHAHARFRHARSWTPQRIGVGIMPRLPVLSSSQIVKALCRAGYVIVRQRGSHIRLMHSGRPQWPVTVPNYKSIDRSLLRLIIQETNLTIEEFLEHL